MVYKSMTCFCPFTHRCTPSSPPLYRLMSSGCPYLSSCSSSEWYSGISCLPPGGNGLREGYRMGSLLHDLSSWSKCSGGNVEQELGRGNSMVFVCCGVVSLLSWTQVAISSNFLEWSVQQELSLVLPLSAQCFLPQLWSLSGLLGIYQELHLFLSSYTFGPFSSLLPPSQPLFSILHSEHLLCSLVIWVSQGELLGV